jgi:hypothetical protein
MAPEDNLIKMISSTEIGQKVSSIINSGGYFVISELKKI